MFLPPEKVLYLPMINGKPKPYDGYRAAPETTTRDVHLPPKSINGQRERKLDHGEIVYGKPTIALSPKRLSGAHSESKNHKDDAPNSELMGRNYFVDAAYKESATNTQKRKIENSLRRTQEIRDEPYSSFKYTKGKKGNKNSRKHSSADSTTKPYKVYENSYDLEDASEESQQIKPERRKLHDSTFQSAQIETRKYSKEPDDVRAEEGRSHESFSRQSKSFQDDETDKPMKTHRFKRSGKYMHNSGQYAVKEDPESRDSSESSYEAEYFTRPKDISSSRLYTDDSDEFLFNWKGTSPVKFGGSDIEQKLSNTYDSSYQYEYKSPNEKFDVPSSIYDGLFQSFEELDEPFLGRTSQEYFDNSNEKFKDKEDEEESQNQRYYHSSSSGSHSFNEYNQHSKGNQYYSSYTDQSTYKSYKSPEYLYNKYDLGAQRPKKFIDDDEVELNQYVNDRKTESEAEDMTRTNVEEENLKKLSKPIFHPTEPTIKETNKQKNNEFINREVCQTERRGEMICTVCKNEKISTTYIQCRYSGKSKEKYFPIESEKSKKPIFNKRKQSSDQRPQKSDVVESKTLAVKPSSTLIPDVAPTNFFSNFNSNNWDLKADAKFPKSKDANGKTINRLIGKEQTEKKDFEKYLYETKGEKEVFDGFDDAWSDISKINDPIRLNTKKEESEKSLKFVLNSKILVEEAPGKQENKLEKLIKKEETTLRPQKQGPKDNSHDFLSWYVDTSENFERVPKELETVDWSNCKKIKKEKITCYQCTYKNGVINETCLQTGTLKQTPKQSSNEEIKLNAPVREVKSKTVRSKSKKVVKSKKSDKGKKSEPFAKVPNALSKPTNVANSDQRTNNPQRRWISQGFRK